MFTGKWPWDESKRGESIEIVQKYNPDHLDYYKD